MTVTVQVPDRYPERDFGKGFFSCEATQNALEDIGDSNRLTIFVGAGVSADLKVPNWNVLTTMLLHDQLSIIFGENGQPIAGLANDIVRESSALVAASMVDNLYLKSHASHDQARNARNEAIRHCLYSDQLGNPRSLLSKQSLAHQLVLATAQLKARKRSLDIQIVSTNFDDALHENAVGLQDYMQDELDVTFIRHTEPPGVGHDANAIHIVHVHGLIPRVGDTLGVVFSEGDYVDWMSGGESSLRGYLADRMQYGLTLMVGSSLRDYNIVDRLMFASRNGRADGGRNPTHIALVPVQGDEVFDKIKTLDSSHYGIAKAAFGSLRHKRAQHIDVELLQPDFFGQVYQFVLEIGNTVARREEDADNEPRPYVHRLEGWWRDFKASKYGSGDSNETRIEVTKKLQDFIANKELREDLLPGALHLKVEVWIRSGIGETTGADPRRLELWCNSQSMYLGDGSHRPHVLQIAEDAAMSPAVEAFALRSTTWDRVVGSTGGNYTGGRWSHYIAQTISLDSPPHYGIPVGAVVLLMDAPEYRSQNVVPNFEENEANVGRKLLELGVSLLSL